MEYILQATGNAATGVTWTTTRKGTDASLFPANFAEVSQMTSYALLHTQRVTAKMAKYLRSRQIYGNAISSNNPCSYVILLCHLKKKIIVSG